MSSLSERIAQLPPEKRRLLLNKLKQSKGEEASGKILPASRASNAIPLSFAQERLWFLDQLDPGGFAYNLPLAIRVRGQLDAEALRLAVNETVRCHEILRTRFLTSDGRPVQVIDPERQIDLPLTDLSLQPETRDDAVKRCTIEEAEKPFDLTTGPLLRARLLKIDDQEHLLLLTMHHIITDAWSLGLFFGDVGAAYEAFARGTAPPQKERALQYADFAVWERQEAQSAAYESKLAFWLDRLSDIPSLLELPLDHPRPAVQTSRGAVKFFKLSVPLSAKIRALGRAEGGTLFMTLLAAFKVLLYRYTGQTDAVVGTPIANRYRPELENLIGFFVNNVVLRTDLSGRPTFRELLRRVKQVTLDSFERSEVPFGKLVEAIQPSRDLSSSPLFHVMFVLQNAPMEDMRLAGLQLSPEVRGNYRISRFDLTLYMGDEGEQIGGAFEYNLDLFESDTVLRMIEHLRVLLENIALNPDRAIDELPLLTAEERRQLLYEWTVADSTKEAPQCFYRVFEGQAERLSEKVAVAFGDERVTYSALNARANQLARYLGKIGVTRESLVGLCMEPCIEMLVALLAILKAGAAYVPLDPTLPRNRIRYMLDDAGITTLLTQQHLLEILAFSDLSVVCTDLLAGEIQQESDINLDVDSDGANLAYVIYTSGSTGKPKGVSVSHAALSNFLRAMLERPGLTERDVLLAVTTLSFDIAGLELYLPLAGGAQVVIAGRMAAADGKSLAHLMATSGASIMQATPATWQMLFDSGWQGNPDLKVLCGGEAITESLAQKLLEGCGSLWNMYGPTETTVWSTVHRVETTDRRIPIGRPVRNTEIYVLDEKLEPAPVGVAGELYIGGAGLARGYYNRPDLTAERFIPHPFSERDGARLYSTGDLVRYRSDATIEFLGRIDHQVKVRGFRIELGEIEATLAMHPSIGQAVVLAAGNETQTLIAYLVALAEEPSATELRDFLGRTLPEYMIPSAFIFLQSLPLTPNGKLNRKELPLPDGSRPVLETEYVEPQNDLERQIAHIWREVLQIDTVGVNDNFFSLGGHSLLLVQAQGKLNNIFEETISILEMFRRPTIRAMANYFEANRQSDSDFHRVKGRAARKDQVMERRRQLRDRRGRS